MLKAGTKAPDFKLKDTNGTVVQLSDFLGKEVVLYFYPKDDTPGCTKEACSFRDDYRKFLKKGVAVFGISPDDEKSHQKFTKKFDLNFPLLSDPDHKVAEKYGAWGPKKLYGKEYEGILRSTFIIGKDGVISNVFEKVKVESHAADVLELIK